MDGRTLSYYLQILLSDYLGSEPSNVAPLTVYSS